MNTPLTTEISKQAEEHISNAMAAYNKASALIVSNQEEYEVAGDFIAELKQYKNRLDKERKDLTGPIDEAKKKIMAKFKPHIDAIEKAIHSIDGKMIAHYREQERIRREKEAEAAEKARKEQEKLLKRADKAEASGKDEKADALRESASQVAPAPVAPTTSKQTSNTTIVKTWKAEVFDKLALIEAVARGEQSMELLECNMTALNRLATAQKDTMKVPGVRPVSEDSIRRK